MAEQVKEFVEIPRQFVKDGTQFINRCTKPDRRGIILFILFQFGLALESSSVNNNNFAIKKFKLYNFFYLIKKKIEYIKISQAVAMGFLVMGFIGFFVKLIHIPINNILVYVLSSFVYACCHSFSFLFINLIFFLFNPL